MNNRSPHLWKTTEWLSTWYDHFRHVYEFVQALYHAIDTHSVDYDSRARDSITEDNFLQKQQELKGMIETLAHTWEQIKIIITAAKTYPDFTSTTSLQRELFELSHHEESHYRYLDPSHQIIPYNNTTYSVDQKTDISLIKSNNIKHDIKQDISRYESLSLKHIPDNIQQIYQKIIHKIEQLDCYDTDDLLIFNNMLTSVSNEYYKIEEELVHLLYDIRLFLKDNQQEFFKQMIEKDPDFWIARSTLQSLTVSS